MASAISVQYAEVPRHPALAGFVQLIWTLEVADPVSFGPAERIVPDGLVEAVFHYRSPFDMRYGNARFGRQAASAVISQTRSFIEIQPAGPAGFISVRFSPWGACHFFRAPVSEFADQMVTAADIWGREAMVLEESIATAPSMAERVRHVQGFLIEQLRRHQKDSVETLIRQVGSVRGRSRVTTVCRDIGVSERTLERVFARTLGMSPKHFLRHRRFLHACHLLRCSERPRLTEIAHRAGYYDQAHCIADFHAFAGMTPREFLTAEKTAFYDIG
jgi:AraC-like DNA-binding protein